MLKYFDYAFRILAFWILFFITSRIYFLLYNFNFTINFSFTDILLVFYHGLKMDFSATAYIVAFPFLFLIFAPLTGSTIQKKVLLFVTIPIISFVSILCISDSELYRQWGFRLDSTPLLYLKNPKEAFASLPTLSIIIFVLATILYAFLWIKIFTIFVYKNKQFTEPLYWKHSLGFVLISASLFIPARGGIGVSTMNVGSVYFHKENFPNHAAINVGWNLAYSLSKNSDLISFRFMDDEKAIQLTDSISNMPSELIKICRIEKPNILILILESFTAKVVEKSGGLKGITPELGKLAAEGIFFQNFYASGDRSDKGIVSILSGFPAQPTSSIIKFPTKTEHLSYLNRELKKRGYTSAFYYGGDINFASMKSYFVNGGFDEIISDKDFSNNSENGKWGAPDHIVFNRLANDMKASENTFIKVLFTLSSHEPFDFPAKPKFGTKNETQRFLSSVNYTDSCLGAFVNQAKREAWWANTLVFIVADHGSRHPGNSQVYEPEKFHIPLVVCGGALTVNGLVYNNIASQTDIPATILGQIGIPSTSFHFSRNLFASKASFAWYAFNNGFGIITETGKLVFDNSGNQVIFRESVGNPDLLSPGKAYLQLISNEFNSY